MFLQEKYYTLKIFYTPGQSPIWLAAQTCQQPSALSNPELKIKEFILKNVLCFSKRKFLYFGTDVDKA